MEEQTHPKEEEEAATIPPLEVNPSKVVGKEQEEGGGEKDDGMEPPGETLALSSERICVILKRVSVTILGWGVTFFACLPKVLIKVSPVLVGIGLAAFAELLLFICIFMRREFRGRSGASFSHGAAFLSIMIIWCFILICAVARWKQRFQKEIMKKKKRTSTGADEESTPEASTTRSTARIDQPTRQEQQTVNTDADLNDDDDAEKGDEQEAIEVGSSLELNDPEMPPEEGQQEALDAETDGKITEENHGDDAQEASDAETDEKLTAHEADEEDDETRFLLTRVKWLTLLLLLPLTIFLLIGMEVVFFYAIPRNSIVPLSADQDALNPQSDLVPPDCNIQERWEEAVQFFNGSVSVDDVMLVYITHTLGRFKEDSSAFEADQTIYFPDEDYFCPQVWLLVHELVHVWQEQTGYWNGPGAAAKGFRMFLDRQRCSSCLYDYGGQSGLVSSWQSATTSGGDGTNNATAANVLTAYGPEQMAEIVEDYYIYKMDYGYCVDYVKDTTKGIQDESWNHHNNSFVVDDDNNATLMGNTTTFNGTYFWHNLTEVSDYDDSISYDDDWYDDGYWVNYCEALHFYACQIINC